MIDTITNLIEQNGIIAIVASIVLGALSSLSPCSLAAIPFISGMAANSYPDLNEEERHPESFATSVVPWYFTLVRFNSRSLTHN